MWIAVLVVAVVVVPSVAAADWSYKLIETRSGVPLFSIDVLVSGDDAVLTSVSPLPVPGEVATKRIWLDGGAKQLMVDSRRRVFYDSVEYLRLARRTAPRPSMQAARSPLRGPVNAPGPVAPSKVSVTLREGPVPVDVGGVICRHVILDVAYDETATFPNDVVRVSIAATMEYFVADVSPAGPLPFDHGVIMPIATSWPDVDAQIEKALKGVSGVALKMDFRTSRTMDTGRVDRTAVSRSLVDFRQVTAPRGAFAVPAGFQLEYPSTTIVPPARLK